MAADGADGDYLREIFDLTSGHVSLENLHSHLGKRLAALVDPSDIAPSGKDDADAPRRECVFTERREEAVKTGAMMLPVKTVEINRAEDADRGRLGGEPVVSMSTTRTRSTPGQVVVKNDVEVESHHNFSSVMANVCVWRGKWMYEVTLFTSGVQQIGFCTLTCPFTNEEGVGDAPDSYAFDGKRGKRWSCSPHNYGERWAVGDIIGVCLDMDGGTLEYFRNGRSLGTAFTGIMPRAGLALFPASSLSFGEAAVFNFGGHPFRYPMDGFSPFQDPPPPSTLRATRYAFECHKRLLQTPPGASVQHADIVRAVLVNRIYQLLPTSSADVLQSYTAEAETIPILRALLKEDLLAAALKDMALALESWEMQAFMVAVMSALGRRCRSGQFVVTSTDDLPEEQRRVVGPVEDLQLVRALLGAEAARHAWVTSEQFNGTMEDLLTIKSVSEGDLKELIPDVWWKDGPEELDRDEYVKHAHNLDLAVVTIEELHYDLVSTMFTDTSLIPGCAKTSQECLMGFLAYLVEKNATMTRNVRPPGMSRTATLVSVFFVVLRLVEPYVDKVRAQEESFPTRAFHNGSLDFGDSGRVGGTQSHLMKCHPMDAAPEDDEPASVDLRLFHVAVSVYHLAVQQGFKQAVSTLQRHRNLASEMTASNSLIERTMDATLLTYRVELTKECIVSMREYVWLQCRLYSTAKQKWMHALHVALVQTLRSASRAPDPLLAYVPEFYVEACVNIFHDLRRSDPPFDLHVGPRGELDVFFNFLIMHFMDARIVNQDLRDTLLQAISLLLQYNEFVLVFEKNELALTVFPKLLLRSFDPNLWISVSNILLRFWRGSGFGQGHLQPAESASPTFQRLTREACLEDASLFSTFLNTLFNNLNWSVTEFSSALKTIHAHFNGSARSAEVLQQQVRKGSIMFELSSNLLRLLEYLTLELPQKFLDEDVNGTRLAEMITYVLNHTAVGGPDATELGEVLERDLAGGKLSRESILAPCVGALLNLRELSTDHSSSIEKMVCSQPGFCLDSFLGLEEFFSNVDAKKVHSDLDRLPRLVAAVAEEQKKMDSAEPLEEDSICTICYVGENDTTFLPCSHSSCQRCISRHLLNSKRCFFCNAEVVATEKKG